jgi:hypothetical protein
MHSATETIRVTIEDLLPAIVQLKLEPAPITRDQLSAKAALELDLFGFRHRSRCRESEST